jgi:hypothetical protein
MEQSFEQVFFLVGQNIFLHVVLLLWKNFLAGLFWYPYIDTIDRPSPLAGQILLQLTLSN